MDASTLGNILLRLGAVLLLVLANGFFVASEFALVGVRRSRVAALVTEGNRRARTLLRVIEQLDAYISATQLGITVASLGLGWVGETTFAWMFHPVFAALLPGPASSVAAHTAAIAMAFATITFLHIVLGELAPKTLALERAERVALAVARPMEIFYAVLKAPIWLLNHSGVLVLRMVGLKASSEQAAVYSEEELRQLIALSHKGGHLIEDERQLIYNVFDFTDSTVESVMVPRTEIEALDANLSPEQMLDQFEESGYSRIPVYRGSLDNVIGILLQKDLSRIVRKGEEATIDRVLRPPFFLPTSATLNQALRELRKSSVHMAMVVDEHGGVEGLVTVEDLLEEIVGEIRDEHDEVAAGQVVELPEGAWAVSGRLSIRDANRLLNLGLPESDTYHTVAGFMMERAGRLLARGDTVEYNGLRLTVRASDKHRIIEAKLEKLPPEDAPAIP